MVRKDLLDATVRQVIERLIQVCLYIEIWKEHSIDAEALGDRLWAAADIQADEFTLINA